MISQFYVLEIDIIVNSIFVKSVITLAHFLVLRMCVISKEFRMFVLLYINVYWQLLFSLNFAKDVVKVIIWRIYEHCQQLIKSMKNIHFILYTLFTPYYTLIYVGSLLCPITTYLLWFWTKSHRVKLGCEKI